MGDSSIGETGLPEVAIVNIVKCVRKCKTSCSSPSNKHQATNPSYNEAKDMAIEA